VAQAAGKDWSAALAKVQAATFSEDCRPEIASSSEASQGGISEPPNPDMKGEGSHDRGMNHQTNSVSRRGRGRGMHENSMTRQRREGEANGPQGQRLARVSRRGPSWKEFFRLADQAAVAIIGMGMINCAEPRACGHSRGSRRLYTEPETRRTARRASNETGNGFGRAQDDQAGFQPYWGKPAVRNDNKGWRNRGQDLMAICHELERADTLEAIGLNRSRLRSNRPVVQPA
jgi:hypothetical protein